MHEEGLIMPHVFCPSSYARQLGWHHEPKNMTCPTCCIQSVEWPTSMPCCNLRSNYWTVFSPTTWYVGPATTQNPRSEVWWWNLRWSFGGKCFWRFSQQKKLENLLPNFAGSSPPISPKTSSTSLWKSLVLRYGPHRNDYNFNSWQIKRCNCNCDFCIINSSWHSEMYLWCANHRGCLQEVLQLRKINSARD